MMGFVLSLLALAALATLAVGIANLPGAVTLEFSGIYVETSLAALVGGGLALILLLLAGYVLGQFLWHMPHRIRVAQAAQKRRQGEAALADGLMALARGDAAAAAQATALARQKQPHMALPRLMSAQAAILAARPDDAEADYRAMLAADTPMAQKTLGLEGLYYLAQARGDYEAAGTHALRVLELAPKTVWALDGLMALSVRLGDWSSADKWLRRWVKSGTKSGVTRAAVKRRRAVLLLAEAQSLLGQDDPAAQIAACEKAEQAATQDASLVPAVALAARLQAAQGQMRKARRNLRQAWARQPHSELADAWLACTADQPASTRLRAVLHLLGKQKTHEESLILRARIALATQRWRLADTILQPLAESDNPSRRVFLLLAEAAEGNGDGPSAQGWYDKARRAVPEAGWMTAGLRLNSWQALCPVTGRLDMVRWQQPDDELGGAMLGGAMGGAMGASPTVPPAASTAVLS